MCQRICWHRMSCYNVAYICAHWICCGSPEHGLWHCEASRPCHHSPVWLRLNKLPQAQVHVIGTCQVWTTALCSLSPSVTLVPPALQRVIWAFNDVFPHNTATNSGTISMTISAVNQKAGVGAGIPLNQPVPETNVTALDGQLVLAPISSIAMLTIIKFNTSEPPTWHLIVNGYQQVFAGTDKCSTKVVNVVIERTGYLTMTPAPGVSHFISNFLCIDGTVVSIMPHATAPFLMALTMMTMSGWHSRCQWPSLPD